MIVDEVHEIISIKQNQRLEKDINFITQKRNGAENGFEKVFYELLVNAFCRKTMEKVRNGCKIEFIAKDGIEKSF